MHNKTEGGSGLLVLILTFGVFGILNTEMGEVAFHAPLELMERGWKPRLVL